MLERDSRESTPGVLLFERGCQRAVAAFHHHDADHGAQKQGILLVLAQPLDAFGETDEHIAPPGHIRHEADLVRQEHALRASRLGDDLADLFEGGLGVLPGNAPEGPIRRAGQVVVVPDQELEDRRKSRGVADLSEKGEGSLDHRAIVVGEQVLAPFLENAEQQGSAGFAIPQDGIDDARVHQIVPGIAELEDEAMRLELAGDGIGRRPRIRTGFGRARDIQRLLGVIVIAHLLEGELRIAAGEGRRGIGLAQDLRQREISFIAAGVNGG